ncbi:MAG: GntR family transcriptional regulator [Chloroflexota bacterium]|nr:GntR family transcriptional regulator [Chloroflexota bacterium]
MIELRIDTLSGLPAYLQIVRQVKDALRLGLLAPGDQMPTIRELVASLAINPNTVLKAYRELEREGLVGGRPGLGTFVLRTLPGAMQSDLEEMRIGLVRWLKRAREHGLDEESIVALFTTTLRQHQREVAA